MLKNLNRFIVFTVLCSLFTISAYAAAPAYKLVDLGLQESDGSEAVAINDNGQVAGMYWMLGKKYYFLWNAQEGIALIDLPETSIIVVLNNAGQIAGNYKDSSGKEKGFIWDQCWGFFDIGTLGGSFTRVYDMNDIGQIVGESESSNVSLVDKNKEQHAFLWQCGCMQDLGALTGDLGVLGDRSQATSINNRGQIIGTSNFLIAHKRKFLRTNNRLVIWQNGIIEEVDPTVEPQHSAVALSINNCGFATSDGKSGVFVVDIANKNKASMESFTNSHALAEINDNGDIFLFMKHNYNLNSKIAYQALIKNTDYDNNFKNISDYERVGFNYTFIENLDKVWKPGGFEGAYDYNNKHWVVGVAENIYGERHGVLLVPINE